MKRELKEPENGPSLDDIRQAKEHLAADMKLIDHKDKLERCAEIRKMINDFMRKAKNSEQKQEAKAKERKEEEVRNVEKFLENVEEQARIGLSMRQN